MQIAANTFALIGAAVTAYGLFTAYSRTVGWSDRLRVWRANVQAWWGRKRGKPQPVGVTPGSAELRLTGGTPDVRVQFQPDASLSTPDRLTRLEDYVHHLADVFTSFNTNIVRLDRAIVDARTHADTTAADALAHAEAKIKDHRGELDKAQRADLRVAAYGVVISMVGIVLDYWA